MKNSIFIFLFVICSLVTGICNAQWQLDVRLTNDPAYSYKSLNNSWSVASSGNFLHVVWFDWRDGNQEIYYKRSSDAGLTWGADTRLTNNSAASLLPSVSVSGSVVHVVWMDERIGNYEIYYKRSTDSGVNWGSDTRLTNDPSYLMSTSISVTGSIVHVVWFDTRDGNDEIYYKRSTDGGISWGADTRLTSNSALSMYPSVSVSGQVVHVVWTDERDGKYKIYFKRSTNGGISWGPDTQLTNNSAISSYPSISVSGSNVHVVWSDERDGNFEIYYKRSTDGGISWGTDSRLTNNSFYSGYPSILVSGSTLHVVWNDSRDGNDEIYYKRSTDKGISWGADFRLTNDSTDSSIPSVTVAGTIVHVVWMDDRDGNYEIYYKRDPTGNPIGIQPISNEIPNQFSLSQNYPNPFNPSTIIRFNIKDSRFTTLKVFDILGREAATLVNEQLKPGTYEVEWNASNYPSGVYYYKIVEGDFVETKKMVLIK